MESAAGGLTWNALLEASSEVFELCWASSGSSGKPIEASIRLFEVSGRAREASSKPNEAPSGPLQASTRALEASSRAFEASTEAFEALTKALETGSKLPNPRSDNILRVLVLTSGQRFGHDQASRDPRRARGQLPETLSFRPSETS